MCDNNSGTILIFQSGQKVITSGRYDAVGTNARTQRCFRCGEVFPDLEGRAICWHLLEVYVEEGQSGQQDNTSTEIIRYVPH